MKIHITLIIAIFINWAKTQNWNTVSVEESSRDKEAMPCIIKNKMEKMVKDEVEYADEYYYGSENEYAINEPVESSKEESIKAHNITDKWAKGHPGNIVYNAITNFPYPKVLDFSDLHLHSIPALAQLNTILSGKQVRQIWAAGTQLEKIPQHFFRGLFNLHTLDLNDNWLEESSLSFVRDLVNIERLILDRNYLISASLKFNEDGIFSKNTQLTTLRLDHNYLTDIPHDLFRFNVKLKTLHLNHNELKSLPPGIFDTNLQLQKLKLFNNPIAYIDYCAFELTNKLMEVDLDSEQLDEEVKRQLLKFWSYKGRSGLLGFYHQGPDDEDSDFFND